MLWKNHSKKAKKFRHFYNSFFIQFSLACSSCPFRRPVSVLPVCFLRYFGWQMFLNKRSRISQGKSPMDGRFRKYGTRTSLISDPDATAVFPLLIRNIPSKILQKNRQAKRRPDAETGRRNSDFSTANTFFPTVWGL